MASFAFAIIGLLLGCGGSGDSPAAPSPPAPIVVVITPTLGPLSGGTTVTLGGTGFQTGTMVTFDGIAATNIIVINPTTMTAIAPAHATGLADIVVANPDGQRSHLAKSYLYTDDLGDACRGCWDYQANGSHADRDQLIPPIRRRPGQ